MNERNAQVIKEIPIAEAARIIYIYEKQESYLENLRSFIQSALKQGEQILVIDNEGLLDLVENRISETYTQAEAAAVHSLTNRSLTDCFSERPLVEELLQTTLQHINHHYQSCESLRLWIHIEVTNETSPVLQQFVYKILPELQMMFVAAFDGHRITAQFENNLKKHYEYFMTDQAMTMSNLYDQTHVGYWSATHESSRPDHQVQTTYDQFEAFVDQHIEPVMLLDYNDCVVFINRAFTDVLEWEKSEIVGKKASELPELDAAQFTEMLSHWKNTRDQETGDTYEALRRTKSGKLLNMLITSYPLVNKHHHYQGRTLVLKDITALKQAQRLLDKNDNQLSVSGEMAAGLAHEIRNPITAIKGFLQLARYEKNQNDNYLSIMNAEIKKIEAILSELILLAKPQVTNFTWNNIVPIVQEATTLLGPKADAAQVQLMTEFDHRRIFIFCDKNQIKQVCINFIKNAIESMTKGGIVTICASSHRGETVMRFTDHGAGMSAEALRRVGTPFFTTKKNGTGLGVMVSKEIIKNHQGTLQIRSHLHRGTQVEIKFPYLLPLSMT
ncbi:MAG: ATP-binding protein [Sporolactobacillus sp.]